MDRYKWEKGNVSERQQWGMCQRDNNPTKEHLDERHWTKITWFESEKQDNALQPK